jgi:cyclophilin family peptidyl-prolyl cis-trans isomerase
LEQHLNGKHTIYGRVLNSVACVARASKAADETRITVYLFLQILLRKDIK